MSKMRRISEFQHEFSFLSASENFQLYLAVPWDDLVSVFKIKESFKGTKNYFSPKGKIALMFLKHYACCSDKIN